VDTCDSAGVHFNIMSLNMQVAFRFMSEMGKFNKEHQRPHGARSLCINHVLTSLRQHSGESKRSPDSYRDEGWRVELFESGTKNYTDVLFVCSCKEPGKWFIFFLNQKVFIRVIIL
jgi:hypothetical protein